MNQAFLEHYLIPCDELKAEDFKTSSVIIFQGEKMPNSFSMDSITSLLNNENYPWLYIAKEIYQNNFYIAIGFEEDSDIPLYVTNILCAFIRNKVFILNIYKCSKNNAKFLKICKKHKKDISLPKSNQDQSEICELLRNEETSENVIIHGERIEQTTSILTNEENSFEALKVSKNELQYQLTNIEENENNEIGIVSSLFSPSEPCSELPPIIPTKPFFTKWTEKLPQMRWESPIRECSIVQTEIEANLGLFNEAIITEDVSPLGTFQNKAQGQLMFFPRSSERFIGRIVNHESIFDMIELSDD